MYKVLWALVVVLFYSVKGICPDEWTIYNNNCYKFGLDIVTWPECQSNCANLGASMLCVTDATTNEWMWDNAGHTETWIGLSDIDQFGTFVWVEGCSSTYTNWEDRQPDNIGTVCLLT